MTRHNWDGTCRKFIYPIVSFSGKIIGFCEKRKRKDKVWVGSYRQLTVKQA